MARGKAVPFEERKERLEKMVERAASELTKLQVKQSFGTLLENPTEDARREFERHLNDFLGRGPERSGLQDLVSR